jgi:hypothetical protein
MLGALSLDMEHTQVTDGRIPSAFHKHDCLVIVLCFLPKMSSAMFEIQLPVQHLPGTTAVCGRTIPDLTQSDLVLLPLMPHHCCQHAFNSLLLAGRQVRE